MLDDDVVDETWSFLNDWPLRRYIILNLAFLTILVSFFALRTWRGDDILTALLGLALVPAIILVPGSGILRIGKYHRLGFIRSLFFSFAIGIGILMAIGFFLNLFHYSGTVVAPLREIPIFSAYSLTTMSITILSWYRDRDHVATDVKKNLDAHFYISWVLAITLPFAVMLAASRINSMDDYSLMFWLVLLICALPLAVYCKPRSYAPLVVSMSIALLLHRALITNYLMGYDVFSEFSAAYITTTNGWWNISERLAIYGGSANTALSIVTLAPMLTNLTSIQTVQMIKIVYPLIFSIVPLGIYKLIEEQFGSRPAFLGVGIFVGYQAFFGLMIQLGKQEIAEIFLVAFLLIFAGKNMTRTKKGLLITVFLSGVMVSHYGIAILVIALTALVVGLQALAHLVGCWIRRKENWRGYPRWFWSTITSWISGQVRTRLVTIWLLLFLIASFLAWYTYTGSGLVLPFIGLETSPSPSFEGAPAAVSIRNLEALEALFIDYGSAVNNIQKYVVVFTQIATVVGMLWVFKEKKWYDRTDNDILFFAAAAAIFLLISYVIPNISGQFYFGRIFTFTSIFLCGFFAIGLYAILKPFRTIIGFVRRTKVLPAFHVDRLTTTIACITVIIMLFTNTGALPSLANNFGGSISLDESASWSVYTDSDVVAAKWVSLSDHTRGHPPTADWHRFPIFGGMMTTPNKLLYQFNAGSTDSFIYLSEWNNKYSYCYPINTVSGITTSYCPLDEVLIQVDGRYDTIYATTELSTVIYIPPTEIDQNPPGPPLYTYEDTPAYVLLAISVSMFIVLAASVLIARRYGARMDDDEIL